MNENEELWVCLSLSPLFLREAGTSTSSTSYEKDTPTNPFFTQTIEDLKKDLLLLLDVVFSLLPEYQFT